ncbi:MAG: cytochrome P450 [Deltaproteobacteria bacterium]|nr:cytochrome P450 [Deltaproteobacteria bacterium]
MAAVTSSGTFTSAPGPASLPFVGPLPQLILYAQDPLGNATKLFKEYGNVVSLVRAPVRLMSPVGNGVVLVNGSALNREVLTNHERYHMYALTGTHYPTDERFAEAASDERERLRPVRRTLTGLFHVNGDEHRRHRRLLQPAFAKTRIDNYRDDMVAIATSLFDEWRFDEGRDMLAEMTELTLRIATKTLFGEDAGERGLQLSRMMQEWLLTMFSPAMLLKVDKGPMPYRRWLDLTRRIDSATEAILDLKKKDVAARLAKGEPIAPDMLSMLVAARDEDGSALDHDELVGHTGVIFAAGHETSTNALTWTLFLLAEHPRVANALVEELEGVLKGEPPTVDQLAKLPYLDAVVKESMRVLPPVPMHPRLVAEDHELGGHFLPARTELFLSIFHMHHDPAVFSQPRRFDPSRWTTAKPSVYEYNPFSAGPRMCIGAAFATMEIKIALAMLLQRFRIEMPEGARVDPRVAITMAPRRGLHVVVRRADKAWQAPVRTRAANGGIRGGIRDLVQLPRPSDA